MGKSIRDYRKNNAKNFLATLDMISSNGYKVVWMGRSGIVEREFDTLAEAKRFSRSIDTAGCNIVPLSL